VTTNVSITLQCRNRTSPTKDSEKFNVDRQAVIV